MMPCLTALGFVVLAGLGLGANALKGDWPHFGVALLAINLWAMTLGGRWAEWRGVRD